MSLHTFSIFLLFCLALYARFFLSRRTGTRRGKKKARTLFPLTAIPQCNGKAKQTKAVEGCIYIVHSIWYVTHMYTPVIPLCLFMTKEYGSESSYILSLSLSFSLNRWEIKSTLFHFCYQASLHTKEELKSSSSDETPLLAPLRDHIFFVRLVSRNPSLFIVNIYSGSSKKGRQ